MTERIPLLALVFFLNSCASSSTTNSETLRDQNLRRAEAFIDAFYTFNDGELASFLSNAAGSAPKLAFYQGWAEGGNYRIINRRPCEAQSPTTISCAITVEDDPVLALGIDFKVTDTFTITFTGTETGTEISSVETSSNDQQIYYDAFDWVTKEMPEVMSGPCQGFFDGGPTPGDCARAMAEGYRRFAASDAYPQQQ